jgi:hypothetical protein
MDGRDRLLTEAVVDVADDLAGALASAIEQLLTSPDVDGALVTHVMLSTGQAITHALEDRAVDRVAVIRIGSPLTRAVPPFTAWPTALRDAVSVGESVVRGGAECDGRSTGALDEEEIARFLDTLAEDVGAVAITGIFSPVAPDHELAAAAVARRVLGPEVRISLSHELGSLGLIERENAAILNAALTGAAQRVAAMFEDTLSSAHVAGEAFVAQNDGALMTLQVGQRWPVLMLDSGPAAAMRGAVHLSGVDDAVVVQAGRTATQIGTVVHGLPKEAASAGGVAGVRIGLRLPDVRRLAPDADRRALASAIDWATTGLQVPLVLAVGPSHSVLPDRLPGLGRLLRPPSGEVAAAVGAALGPVTGRAERVSEDRPDRRREALDAAQQAATELAVHAGADPDRLQVVGADEAQLTYDVEPVVRISVKVAGPPL